MNVKNYRARTPEECIRKLKLDMGRDAVILQSRTLRRPLFGMIGPAMHEIVAVSDGNTLLDTLGRRAAAREAEREPAAVSAPPRLSMTSAPPSPRSTLRHTGRLTLAEAASLAESGAEGREAALALIAEAAGLRSGEEDRVARIEKQVAAISEALAPGSPPAPKPAAIQTAVRDSPAETQAAQAPAPAPNKPAPFLRYRIPAPDRNPAETAPPPAESAQIAEPDDPYRPIFDQVRKAAVAEALVRRLRTEIPDGLARDDAREALHDLLVGRLTISGAIGASPGKLTAAALFGSTGVGKTTTAAKLAAQLSLSEGLRVAMVSLDTQRVAGTAQLAKYGEILGADVRVAYDKADLEKALVELASRGAEVVLIDTPGCGPGQALVLAELSASLRSVVNLSNYLVVPATLSASNFDQTIQRFSKTPAPTAMILSKLDETADNHCLGFLMNSQAKYGLPLAYVTTGARVPDDLLVADGHALIAKVLAPSIA